jgi:hypothetical protein
MTPFYIPRNINPIIGGVLAVIGFTVGGALVFLYGKNGLLSSEPPPADCVVVPGEGIVTLVAGRTLDGNELPALVARPLLSDDGAAPTAAPPVELFFERAGGLRYPSVERGIGTGTWTVRDGRLCTQKESGFEWCRTVCRRKDTVILWRNANNHARGTLWIGNTVRPEAATHATQSVARVSTKQLTIERRSPLA